MWGLGILAVVIAWLWFCFWLTRKLVPKLPLTKWWTKLLVGLLTFFVLVPAPFVDEMIGKVKFDKLCRERSGTKVYGKLELGSEYFNVDGTPKFIDPETGFVDDGWMKTYVLIERPPSKRISTIAKLTEGHFYLKSRLDGKTLLESVDFGSDGGWLSAGRSAYLFSSGCPDVYRPLGESIKNIVTQKRKEIK